MAQLVLYITSAPPLFTGLLDFETTKIQIWFIFFLYQYLHPFVINLHIYISIFIYHYIISIMPIVLTGISILASIISILISFIIIYIVHTYQSFYFLWHNKINIIWAINISSLGTECPALKVIFNFSSNRKRSNFENYVIETIDKDIHWRTQKSRKLFIHVYLQAGTSLPLL